ncbi:tRNA pseudouridine(38-40) synthase TruA [Treponema brennaborense]|uniref:tRNA pseudouridine synthase A n=1 Tax=Treponema brennaborense (strain DSM 12168 / CIP 105900 / DD5/3) TaxID=906968 RepID=F4LL00_TREBD|nr:tRNA pseudouridine(38-40) synthase TruA [Treponema brennaborense]AEE16597.1 tRNA pseudouridine synthase A [Treponema brennaborense DSM 12168]
MKNVLLTVSYDGTDFCGWQRQDHADRGEPVRTVQAELERALRIMLKTPVALTGSGRTDSGVHAFAQAANFLSPFDSVPPENYVPALNSSLPPDVRVTAAREVPPGFHARFDARMRTYRYFLYCGATPPAHETRYVWPIRRYPDIARLNRMASCLYGEIDCTTFAAAGDPCESKKRYLEKAVFYADGDKLVFEIAANAFLWKMVRSVVGSLVYYEQKGKDADFFAEILRARDRRSAGPTAPPQGLFLWNVDFESCKRH